MEMSKSIVGKHVENLFLENVASKILEFLELTKDQQHEYAKRLMFYETLQAYRLKRNWKVPLERYKKCFLEDGEFRQYPGCLFYEVYYEVRKAEKENREVKITFDKYSKNLAFDDEAVYSYGTPVIELNWRNLTARRLGSWSSGAESPTRSSTSRTASKHQAFAIRALATEWAFREIT